MKFRINGVDYHVAQTGTGDPLVLLHGFTGKIASWAGVVPVLEQRYCVIALDLLGHGGTDAPADPDRYAIEHAAADLVALFDALDVQQAHLLGYSMGGRLALYTALTYPARFTRLTLESASPGIADPAERAARRAADAALADRIEREGIAWFADYWAALPLFASQTSLSGAARARLDALRRDNRPHGLANSLRGMGAGAQPPLWDRLAALTLPVTLIVGALDAKYVALAGAMAAALPHAHPIIVPAAGHTVHLEQPDAWLAALFSI